MKKSDLKQKTLYLALASTLGMGTLSGCVLDSDDNNSSAQQEEQQTIGEQTIGLTQVGSYATGVFDESAAEIVAFDETTQQTFVVNANSGQIDVLNASDVSNPALSMSIDLANDLVVNGFAVSADEVGAANSVSVVQGLVAVAVQAEPKTDNGWVSFYRSDDLSFIDAKVVGALPDMLTFSSNGNTLIVANEGEPSEPDYATDPEGSVSLLDINWDGTTLNSTVTNIGFTDFNAGNSRHSELPADILLNGLNASVSQDLEPEYIAISEDNSRALVALQENNAIVDIDLASKTITKIFSLGLKDHSIEGYGFDGNNKDETVLIKPEAALGMYMPDSIASYTVEGTTYLVTANEGDSRDDWLEELDQTTCETGGFYYNFEDEVCIDELTLKDAFDNEVYSPASMTATLDLSRFDDGGDLSETVNRVKFSHSLTLKHGDLNNDGTIDRIYTFGGRSFSIYNAETGAQVYDSGDAFEQITAEKYGIEFNNDNAENAGEDRSDNKGPEPEALTVGSINGHTYAFIGLERMGGIMVYEITNPSEPKFIQYLNNRDVTVDNDTLEAGGAGDLGPEGFKFVEADKSPTGAPMLIVGNEVSGTTTFYNIDVQ